VWYSRKESFKKGGQPDGKPHYACSHASARGRGERPDARGKALLLFGLALTLVLSILLDTVGYQIHSDQVNIASTATAQAQTYATATFIATNLKTLPPPGGKQSLSDPLLDNSKGYNWEEYSLNSYGSACQFAKDGYHAIEEQNYLNTCHMITSTRNFSFEVEMTILKGLCGGIAFRDTQQTASYIFFVCEDGTYTLFNYSTTPADSLISSSSSFIKTGLHQKNSLGVTALGNSFSFFANGQFIDSAHDNTISEGTIGLIANYDTATTTTSEVVYRNALLWTL
jgi:hypothetical protein